MPSTPPVHIEPAPSRTADQHGPSADNATGRMRMLLRALMYAIVAGFILDQATDVLRRRGLEAVHEALTHFGDHHTPIAATYAPERQARS
ncbi:hypothetical protein ACWEKT_20690 [Nocardia takedensis]